MHSRPDYYCPRCYEVFESSNLLDGHVRQANSCIVGDCPFPEKFTDGQMKELKKKWPGKTAEECWYIIFGILFPDSVLPANPCKKQYTCLMNSLTHGQMPKTTCLKRLRSSWYLTHHKCSCRSSASGCLSSNIPPQQCRYCRTKHRLCSSQ